MNNAAPKYRILVIDDNREIHLDFRKILCDERFDSSDLESAEKALFGKAPGYEKQSEFELGSAFQAREGLARVHHALQENRPYDLAFVDMRMPPGWDGLEVIPKLWLADPNLQIVICTAYSDYSWEEIFERIGRSHHLFILKKPFERIEVLQLAHALTEKSQLLRRKG